MPLSQGLCNAALFALKPHVPDIHVASYFASLWLLAQIIFPNHPLKIASVTLCINYLPIVYRNMNPHTVGFRVLCSLLNPQHLKLHLAYTRHSEICEKMKTVTYYY